jgi:hypothetical protein
MVFSRCRLVVGWSQQQPQSGKTGREEHWTIEVSRFDLSRIFVRNELVSGYFAPVDAPADAAVMSWWS